MTPTRFPRFFEEAAQLPPQIRVPSELTPSEEEELEYRVPLDPRERPNYDFSGGPPHWLFPIDEDDDESGVHDVEVADLSDHVDAVEGSAHRGEGDVPDAPSGRWGTSELPDIDAVAFYAPWHFYGDDWGIYFTKGWSDFVTDLAFYASQPTYLIEPFAFHQVLHHELTHFDFEVVATEFEAMLEQSVYREYSLRRFMGHTRWAAVPLEEAVATYAEVDFARGRRPRRPKGYVSAVRKLADLSPPGYRDWRLMVDDRRADLATGALASLIADQRLAYWAWGGTTSTEDKQVPVRWRGDARLAPSFLTPKSIARPTVAQLERFLTANHAQIIKRGGKGSHRKFRWRGKTGGYATSRPMIPKDESDRIATIFGFDRAVDLYEAIQSRRIII